MNLIKNRKIIKILSTLLLIILLVTFVIPKVIFGVVLTPQGMETVTGISSSDYDDEKSGGKLFRPIAQLLAFVADLSIELAQQFLWDGSTINEENGYKVYIGPATIFTGKIPRIRC